jgi:hypothetical protein
MGQFEISRASNQITNKDSRAWFIFPTWLNQIFFSLSLYISWHQERKVKIDDECGQTVRTGHAHSAASRRQLASSPAAAAAAIRRQ